MKRIFATSLICLSFSSFALPDFDGCYQLYLPEVMYPAFCISGTTEEGIGGSGAKLVIFNTNTNNVLECLTSSGLSMNAEQFVFEINGKKELILKNFEASSALAGDAIIGGSTTLKFMKLSETTARPLVEAGLENGCL